MFRFLIILVVGFLTLAGSSQTSLTQAPEFNVKDSEGNVYDLFDILSGGQYVFIDFFDVSCGPCQFFAPEIEQSYVNFGENNAAVFFIGLSLIGDNALLDEWDSTFGIQYPTISGFEGGAYAIHQLYQVQSYPTLVLIAPDQSIVSQLFLPDYSPFTSTIDSMLVSQGLSPVSAGAEKLPGRDVHLKLNNPVQSHLVLYWNSDKNSWLDFVVYSNNGMPVRVFNGIEMNAGQNKITLDVADLPKGLYVISMLKYGKVIENQKWIKE